MLFRTNILALIFKNTISNKKNENKLIVWDSHKDQKIISLLVDAQDQAKLEMILETFKVDTVYHAAAYKHVPLIEENPLEGLKNNALATQSFITECMGAVVSSFVLISTDKAVDHSTVMGTSKLMAEKIFINAPPLLPSLIEASV